MKLFSRKHVKFICCENYSKRIGSRLYKLNPRKIFSCKGLMLEQFRKNHNLAKKPPTRKNVWSFNSDQLYKMYLKVHEGLLPLVSGSGSASRQLYSTMRSTLIMLLATSADWRTPHCSRPESAMHCVMASPGWPPIITVMWPCAGDAPLQRFQDEKKRDV